MMKIWVAAAGLMALMVSAQAVPVFQGRLGNGTASDTCTVSGLGKCTSFYDSALDITILNDWNIGQGTWSATAAPGSAQALAESAGFAATGLTGWVLPTGDGWQPGGSLNQYKSILQSVHSAGNALAGQFDGVQTGNYYWSGSPMSGSPFAWVFDVNSNGSGGSSLDDPRFVVAVRAGDIAIAVPEPQTWMLMLMGFGAMATVSRRRRE
jgi:hypothetical protein